MRQSALLLLLLLPATCFSHVSFRENTRLSRVLLTKTPTSMNHGTIIKEKNRPYYYIQVNQKWINQSYALLKPYLKAHHQLCFHQPTDLDGQAHITLLTHYSAALQPYLGKTIRFSPLKVEQFITTAKRHHQRVQHHWYVVAVKLQNPPLNQLLQKLHPDFTVTYHISFAVAKYNAQGQCILPKTIQS